MPEFSVHVTTSATDVTDEQLDQLVDELTPWAGTPGMADGRLDVQLTVAARNIAEAPEKGLHATLGAMTLANISGEPVAVQAMTTAEFSTWLTGLVSTAEAAKILGVSRQRILQLERDDPNMPAPAQVGRAKQWPAAALRRYAAARRRASAATA